MSTMATKCPRCGRSDSVERPEGDGAVIESLRRLAAVLICDTCASKANSEEKEAEATSRLRERQRSSGVPTRWQFSLDAFEVRAGQEKALAAARDWAARKDAGGLMLLGAVGRGKSAIAAAACWSRLAVSPCRYASVARSFAALSARFDDRERAQATSVFSGAGAIVLDDLDKSRTSDFGLEHLFAAVDNRYQASAPLLVTTNLTPSEIGEVYGPPIMSRLVGYCRVVEVAGVDHRLPRPELRAA